jgi:hypothetical protein
MEVILASSAHVRNQRTDMGTTFLFGFGLDFPEVIRYTVSITNRNCSER